MTSLSHRFLTALIFGLMFICPQGAAWAMPCNYYTEILLPDDAEPPFEAEIIAKISVLGFTKENGVRNLEAQAKIVDVLKTSDPRIKPGAKVVVKYNPARCGGFNGQLILASLGSDVDDRLILCPYTRTNSKIETMHLRDCAPRAVAAAKATKRAALKGDVKAQIAMGHMYEEGELVRLDNKESLKWFHLAAKSGEGEALYQMGKKVLRDLRRKNMGLGMDDKKEEGGPEAVKWYKLAAQKGHVGAMNDIGWIYEKGIYGLKKNKREALKWYRLAAETRKIDAIIALGRMYETGAGVKPDINKAIYWYGLGYSLGNRHTDDGILREIQKHENIKSLFRAAENGKAQAQYECGLLYASVGYDEVKSKIYKAIVPPGYSDAKRWLTLAAEQGHAPAAKALVDLIAEDSSMRDSTEARKTYTRAAELGYGPAQYQLGQMHWRSMGGLTKNEAEAIKWSRLAADQGYLPAIDYLAQTHLRGGAVTEKEVLGRLAQAAEKGEAEVEAWLEIMARIKALSPEAENGSAEAQFELGRIYRQKQAPAKALELFRLAAAQEQAGAMNEIGEMYKYGLGVEKDLTEARKWFKLAADMGHSQAQYNYADLCDGIRKHAVEMTEFFRRAAEQGHIEAQYRLAQIYQTSSWAEDGIGHDYEKAAKWFRLAAEQGHLVAQAELGEMYLIGYGVEQSDAEAAKWFRLAGEKNRKPAEHLAEMYMQGRVVPENDEEAENQCRMVRTTSNRCTETALSAGRIQAWPERNRNAAPGSSD